MQPSRRIVALAVLSVFVTASAGGFLWLHSSYRVESVAQIGRPLPALAFIDSNGRQVHFDRYLGRKVLAVFGDPQCGYCQDQYQVLLEFDEAALDSIAVVAVVQQDPIAPVDLSREQALPFPVWIDAHNQLRRKLGVAGVPALLLLDEQGVLRSLQVGYQSLESVTDLVHGEHEKRLLFTSAAP